jgi:hypothetical protein
MGNRMSFRTLLVLFSFSRSNPGSFFDLFMRVAKGPKIRDNCKVLLNWCQPQGGSP